MAGGGSTTPTAPHSLAWRFYYAPAPVDGTRVCGQPPLALLISDRASLSLPTNTTTTGTQCTHTQVVCTGAFPCDRCWRLALPCRLQTTAPSHAPTARSATHSFSPFSGGGDGEGDGDGQLGEEGAPPKEPSAAAAASSPHLQLVFTRANPKANAELLSKAFMELHASGRVVRERALFAMYVEEWGKGA